MPTPTILFEDLITPVTEPEIEASVFKVFGISGLDTSSWKSGAVVRTLTSAFSILLASFSQLQAVIARSGYLDLSEGDWLTVVAFYVYGVERYAATFATGTVTLSNEAGGVYDFDPEDLIFSNPVTGKTYRNTSHVSIPSGSTAAPARVFNVPIRAVESGAESTSQVGTITAMVATVTGVSVVNEIAAVGQDAEGDAALRARASARLGAISPAGPWDAYTYAVRSATRPAPDGSNLGITRTRITNDGYGNVWVYMATPSGAVQPEDVPIAQAAIELNAEPLCVNATAVSAFPYTAPFDYELWMYNTSGRTDAQIKDLIKAELTTWLSMQPIGGNLIDGDPQGRIYLDKIIAVIGDTLPEIYHVKLISIASDILVNPEQVVLLGPTNGIIHQSSPPVGFGI